MRVAIIGTGQVGRAIARGLTGKGHEVVFGSRSAGGDAPQGVPTMPPAKAVEGAEIVVLALPWAALPEALAPLGDLAGQIVIDCTNPIGRTATGMGLTLGHDRSGGEMVQGWLPHARVVKTLNQVGAEIMADSTRLAHRPAMFMAGNDAPAKGQTAALLSDLGFDPLDAGDITKARLLEPLGMVWINQALIQGKGRHWAFAAVSA